MTNSGNQAQTTADDGGSRSIGGAKRQRWWVSLEKEQSIFSAAHFITFAGDICERIHGHNYRVRCEIAGPLDENRYVVDFILLRDSLQELTKQLDHHVLLPAEHPEIRVVDDGREVTATFRERRWVFPSEDAVILPVANTTAELIAGWLAERLLEKLAERGASKPSALRIGVDENEGQWGIVELEFDI